MQPQPEESPTITVIIPTLNEAENIVPLLNRLSSALSGTDFEVLFVDDSIDHTRSVIQGEMAERAFQVRLIARPPVRHNGLSGAVVEGFAAAHGHWVCVMDGDLQHPPELLPQMLDEALKTGADMVVGSRRANLLGPMGLTITRTFISQILTILARALFPRSLKDVSDPLTGLFLIRREKVLLDRLRPNGFKILLEILVRCPHMRIVERYFNFGERQSGESKADFREGVRFFRHLLTLRLSAYQRPLLKYLLVGMLGILLNIGILVLMDQLFHPRSWPLLIEAILLTILTDAWIYWGNRWFVIPKEEQGRAEYGRYFLLSLPFILLLHIPVFWMLFVRLGWELIPSQISAFAFTGFCRYLLSDRWIWTRGLLSVRRPVYRYNIHELVTIDSPVPIPDLAWFQQAAQNLDRVRHGTVDIHIRIDRHGTPRRLSSGLSYDDRLGRLGYSLTVLPGERFTEVVISPLIARSNHVLYINVVEPLIRYVLLHRHVALIRGGTVVSNHEAWLLSAPTRDKTTEMVLEKIRSSTSPVKYLSHDLTLIRADGTCFAFPNTVIQHKALEWPLIRQIGAQVRRGNLPATTIGAWVQSVWPPQQLNIQQVAEGVEIESETLLDRVVVTDEEGVIVTGDRLISTLQANSQDLLGFPLFEDLVALYAEGIQKMKGKGPFSIEKSRCEFDLLCREREILASALQTMLQKQ